MIDVKEQYKWLEEWVKDDTEGLGTDLDIRVFNALEVAIIMQIYTEKQLAIQHVSQQRELFVAMFDKMNDDDIQECINGFAGRVFDRVSNQ